MAGGDLSKVMESKAITALVAGIGIIVVFVALGSIGVNLRISDSLFSILFTIIIIAVAIWFIAGSSAKS